MTAWQSYFYSDEKQPSLREAGSPPYFVCAAVDKDVGRYPAPNHHQMRGPKGPQRHQGLLATQAEQVVIT